MESSIYSSHKIGCSAIAFTVFALIMQRVYTTHTHVSIGAQEKFADSQAGVL